MPDSIVSALNHAAEIFGHAPLSAGAARTYLRATRAPSDEVFTQRLFDLIAASERFPLPRDFGLGDAASSRQQEA